MAKIFALEDEVHKYPRNQIKEIFKNHTLTLALSREEAGRMWEGPYDVVLLDHDMRGFFDPSTHPNTGYMFLANILMSRAIVTQLKQALIFLHSQNTEGRTEMSNLLIKYNLAHESMPFSPAYLNRLRIVEKDLPR